MKQKGRARLYWSLVILIFVSIAGIVAISFFSCQYAVALAKRTSSGVASVDILLSAGIGIMGIMIAVWTGLSISNVISRKDVDTLNRDIEAARVSMKAISTYISQDVHIQAELFYVETCRNNWDPLLRYLIQSFPLSEIKGEITNLFSDLTIIELKYTQVKSRHQSKNVYDKNLIAIADEGLNKIESIKKERTDLPEYVENYLNYRKCGFNFYAGYCEKNKTLGAERFVKAAQGYRRLASSLAVSFDKRDQQVGQDENNRKCHLANSIGESYSKIVQYYSEEEMGSQFSNRIRQYAKDAIKYCEIAANKESGLDLHTLSVFSRNLGCAYERVDILMKKIGESTKYEDKTIDALKYSIFYARAADSANSADLISAYFIFLTYLGEYLYETREKMDENLLNDMYRYARDAYEYFPFSLEFTVLYEFATRLYKKGGLLIIDTQIDGIVDVRNSLIVKDYFGERVSILSDRIKQLKKEAADNYATQIPQ